MVFTGLCFDELLAYKTVSVLIRMFEKQFDPIFAITSSNLKHLANYFLCGGPIICPEYSVDDAINLSAVIWS